jgi:hypothetical protein
VSGHLGVTAYVRPSGPIADGLAGAVMEKFTQAARQAIADEGARMLRDFPMNKTGRASGGFRANLRVLQTGPAIRIRGGLVTGVTWAPWLEGTSKRNMSTSFKGYRLFRKTRLDLDRKAVEIAERTLQDYLPQLGGE